MIPGVISKKDQRASPLFPTALEKLWLSHTSAMSPMEDRMLDNIFFVAVSHNRLMHAIPLVFLSQLALVVKVKKVPRKVTGNKHFPSFIHNFPIEIYVFF